MEHFIIVRVESSLLRNAKSAECNRRNLGIFKERKNELICHSNAKYIYKKHISQSYNRKIDSFETRPVHFISIQMVMKFMLNSMYVASIIALCTLFHSLSGSGPFDWYSIRTCMFPLHMYTIQKANSVYKLFLKNKRKTCVIHSNGPDDEEKIEGESHKRSINGKVYKLN